MTIRKRTALCLLAAAICLGAHALLMRQRKDVLRLGIFVGSPWDNPYSDYYDVVDTAVAKFEEAHPGVTVEYVSGLRYEDYSEWLAEQLLLGQPPDVFLVLDTDYQKYISMGNLLELNDLAADDTEFDPEKYYPAAFEAGKMGDTLYALPFQSATTVMFYNKTLLEQEGMRLPAEDWTWVDFYRLCSEVTRDRDQNGVYDQFGCYGYRWEYAAASNNAPIVNKEGTECYFDDPRLEQAVRFCDRLYQLGGGYKVQESDFDDGNVAFRVMNIGDYRNIEYYPRSLSGQTPFAFEWGYCRMPAGPQGGNTSCLDTQVVGISAETDTPELAWELAKLLSYDTEVQAELYSSSAGASVLRVVEWDQAMYRKLADELLVDAELLNAVMDEATQLPKYEWYDQTLAAANNRLEKIFYGDADVDATLMALQHEMTAFLRR